MYPIKIPECPIQAVVNQNGIQIDVLREDLNHALIQGNKFRKLKYNLMEAKRQKMETLLTFGGAYSNHIHATAAAAKSFGFKSVGFIRGEELAHKDLNPTLKEAEEMGMTLNFISRKEYRDITQNADYHELKLRFPNAYILPEGGSNEFAVRGCEEILDSRTKAYDYICLPIGTAATMAGVIRASQEHQKIIGFPALKDSNFLKNNIEKYTSRRNYEIINAYHFGGYAKFTEVLIRFVQNFYFEFKIPIEPIYTGKAFFGVMDLLKNDYFYQNSKILIIHTGGLQGLKGLEQLRTIDFNTNHE